MQHLPGSDAPGILTAVDPAQWSRVDKSEYEGTTAAGAMAGLTRGGAVIAKGSADETGSSPSWTRSSASP